MDGFDVLAISVSAGIMSEFGIDRADLGWVLNMELIGMALGSVFLGGFADKIGRRQHGPRLPRRNGGWHVPATTSASGGGTLMAWRVFTGLGIGGMLATINAIVAEFSNRGSGDVHIDDVIGYPLGAIIAATWSRASWYAGATTGGHLLLARSHPTAALIPVVYFACPNRCTGWRANSRKAP